MERLHIKNLSSSIVYRLTMYILIIIVCQTLLFGGILISGGVIDEATSNAYQLFHEKTSSRTDYIQREMKKNWINFDPYVTNITKDLNESSLNAGANHFFEATVSELIKMLRATQVTGAYMILYDGSSPNTELPAIYLRDYDPIMNSYSDDDLYMVYGPANLAKKMKIPLDQNWRYAFEMTENNHDFITKPYKKASMTNQTTLLGYWSKPFQLQSKDISIITYSIPLLDSRGNLRGIIGIEIDLNYFDQFLPSTELQSQDSLGYMVAYSNDGEPITPIIMGGALQRRMIDENHSLVLELVDKDRNIYTLGNHNSNQTLYVSVEQISLYQYNTPFEDEHWYLVGIMSEDYLLSSANHIKDIYVISFFSAVFLGTIGAMLISLRMSKPIVNLANQVNNSYREKELVLEPTGLIELDELSRAIEFANKRTLDSTTRLDKIVEMFDVPIGAYEINYELNTVFVTNHFYKIIGRDNDLLSSDNDLQTFSRMITELLEVPVSDELDVYEIGGLSKRWIRFKFSLQGNSTIGVVLDVTDEILEKRQIKRERDHDPLTQVLNRQGFKQAYLAWTKKQNPSTQAAILMLDLDNLKTVNDSYGHGWGDRYILTAVEQLKRIAPANHSIVGRRSGDEFMLLLYGFRDKDSIRACLEQFYTSLASHELLLPSGEGMGVMISAGIKWIDDTTLSYDELLHFADEALYVAKRTHKGYYEEHETNPLVR